MKEPYFSKTNDRLLKKKSDADKSEKQLFQSGVFVNLVQFLKNRWELKAFSFLEDISSAGLQEKKEGHQKSEQPHTKTFCQSFLWCFFLCDVLHSDPSLVVRILATIDNVY